MRRCDEDGDAKQEVLSGSNIAAIARQNDSNPQVTKRQNVNRESINEVKISVEVGVLTESELKQLMDRLVPGGGGFEESSNVLKSSSILPVNMKDHLGENASLYVVSLRNLPCHEIHSMRRMQVASTSLMSLQDCLVEASRQLSDRHGDVAFKHHVTEQLAQLPSGFKDTGGLRHLHDIPSLLAKVQKKASKLAEAKAKAKAADDDEPEGGSEQEPSEREQMRQGQHQDFYQLSTSSA